MQMEMVCMTSGKSPQGKGHDLFLSLLPDAWNGAMTAGTRGGLPNHDVNMRTEASNGEATRKTVGVGVLEQENSIPGPFYLRRFFHEKEICFYILNLCYFGF